MTQCHRALLRSALCLQWEVREREREVLALEQSFCEEPAPIRVRSAAPFVGYQHLGNSK